MRSTHVYSHHDVVSPDEMTYVSFVAAWLRHKAGTGEVELFGERRHPVLRTSRIEPDRIRYLESLGY